MKTLILHHNDCLRHDTGRRHVEAPARVTAVLNGVKNLPGTETLPAPRASFEQLRLAHVPEYWERLVELEPPLESEENRVALDGDTFLSAGSIDATLRAGGVGLLAGEPACVRSRRRRHGRKGAQLRLRDHGACVSLVLAAHDCAGRSHHRRHPGDDAADDAE